MPKVSTVYVKISTGKMFFLKHSFMCLQTCFDASFKHFMTLHVWMSLGSCEAVRVSSVMERLLSECFCSGR